MTKQIETTTLRDWLEAQQPVTVLDIRTDEGFKLSSRRETWMWSADVSVRQWFAAES